MTDANTETTLENSEEMKISAYIQSLGIRQRYKKITNSFKLPSSVNEIEIFILSVFQQVSWSAAKCNQFYFYINAASRTRQNNVFIFPHETINIDFFNTELDCFNKFVRNDYMLYYNTNMLHENVH